MLTLALLEREAPRFGAVLEAAQYEAFELYRDALISWNRRVNLTAIVQPDEIERRHFLDSLSCLAGCADLLAERPDARLVDVGTGGGFPGLPLKIVRPKLRLTLIESVAKKCAFLEHVVGLLDLHDVEVVTARAEDLARDERYRQACDLAVSRAVAGLPALLELTLPFLRLGGRLIAPRRGDLVLQQHEAERAAATLGGRFRPPVRFEGSSLGEEYGLVLVDKVGPTPPAFPRRAGLPVKRPLL